MSPTILKGLNLQMYTNDDYSSIAGEKESTKNNDLANFDQELSFSPHKKAKVQEEEDSNQDIEIPDQEIDAVSSVSSVIVPV